MIFRFFLVLISFNNCTSMFYPEKWDKGLLRNHRMEILLAANLTGPRKE